MVGDVAGFAAAVYLRGVPFIQIPTTLLAQIDSSVGGKTGVNLPAARIWSAVFISPPRSSSMSKRWPLCPRASWLPAGANASNRARWAAENSSTRRLIFCRDSRIDEAHDFAATGKTHRCSLCFQSFDRRGDEREDPGRVDRRSRRILNFGHTIAHALEAVTNYRRFRHGEAVGHGMLVAGELSKNLGLLDQSELELLQRGSQPVWPTALGERFRRARDDQRDRAGQEANRRSHPVGTARTDRPAANCRRQRD